MILRVQRLDPGLSSLIPIPGSLRVPWRKVHWDHPVDVILRGLVTRMWEPWGPWHRLPLDSGRGPRGRGNNAQGWTPRPGRSGAHGNARARASGGRSWARNDFLFYTITFNIMFYFIATGASFSLLCKRLLFQLGLQNLRQKWFKIKWNVLALLSYMVLYIDVWQFINFECSAFV